jgi:hypothetical protein
MASQTKKAASDQEYTKPELREKLKKKIQGGDKGGRPGQWSARKAQLLAQEYKHEGGSYKKPRTKKQESLNQWTEEKWTTADGKKAVRGKTTARYLPKKAWDQLSPAEKKATNKKKEAGARQGKQFVANTKAAAGARKKATKKTAAKKTSTKKTATKKTAAKKKKS